MREIALRPGGTAEWVFIANRSGRFRLECGIPTHVEAGMEAEIIVG